MDCPHFETMTLDITPSGDGCVECLATGGRWLHLRECLVGLGDRWRKRHLDALVRERADRVRNRPESKALDAAGG